MELGMALAIVSVVLAVVGLPATYFIGRRSRQTPDLCSLTDFDVLMAPEDGITGGELDLKFGKHTVTRISRTYVAIWNHRGDLVRGADIVEADPLRISVAEGDAILQVRLLAQSRSQCQLRAGFTDVDSRSINIDFDFLDAGDGGVFEVLHQGEVKASPTGTIRGAKLRNRGTADLDPTTLQARAAKSFKASFLHAVSGKRGKGGKLRAASLVLVLLMPIGMAGFMLHTAVRINNDLKREPQLVPVDQFDISTLQGQQEFIELAVEAGFRRDPAGQGQLVISLVVMVILYIAIDAFMVWYLVRHRLPASILTEMIGTSKTEEAPSSQTGDRQAVSDPIEDGQRLTDRF